MALVTRQREGSSTSRVVRSPKKQLTTMTAREFTQRSVMPKQVSYFLVPLKQRIASPWTKQVPQEIRERKLKKGVSSTSLKKDPSTPSRLGRMARKIPKGQRLLPKFRHIEWNHCGQRYPTCSILGKKVTKDRMKIPNHSINLLTFVLRCKASFSMRALPASEAFLKLPTYSWSWSAEEYSAQASPMKMPKKQGVQRVWGLMKMSKMQSWQLERALRVMGYSCWWSSVQTKLTVQEKATRAAAKQKDPSLDREQKTSTANEQRKTWNSICMQKAQLMQRVCPLLTRLSMKRAVRHMFLHSAGYSSSGIHFGPFPQWMNIEYHTRITNKQAGRNLSARFSTSHGYLLNLPTSFANLQAMKKPPTKKKMSTVRSAHSTMRMKGLWKTKSSEMMFTAPMMLLMKVLPIMTHIRVKARIPSNTLKLGSLLAVKRLKLSCKANPLVHPTLVLLKEATATSSPISTRMTRVRQKVQWQGNSQF